VTRNFICSKVTASRGAWHVESGAHERGVLSKIWATMLRVIGAPQNVGSIHRIVNTGTPRVRLLLGPRIERTQRTHHRKTRIFGAGWTGHESSRLLLGRVTNPSSIATLNSSVACSPARLARIPRLQSLVIVIHVGRIADRSGKLCWHGVSRHNIGGRSVKTVHICFYNQENICNDTLLTAQEIHGGEQS